MPSARGICHASTECAVNLLARDPVKRAISGATVARSPRDALHETVARCAPLGTTRHAPLAVTVRARIAFFRRAIRSARQRRVRLWASSRHAPAMAREPAGPQRLRLALPTLVTKAAATPA